MAHITAVISQKGGVGKSSTAQALGAGLQRRGGSILYIDLDAQQNLSYTLGADTEKPGAYNLLTGRATAKEAIQTTVQGVDIIAASARLAEDGVLADTPGKEYRLRECLEPIASAYKRIVIDCPPSLGTLTINALTAATDIIVPTQADIYSVQSLGQLSQTLDAIKKYTNPRLKIAGILITRYSGRAVLNRDMADMLEDTAKRLGTKVYSTRVRECVAVREAQAVRKDIFSYAPRSNAARDYEAFIMEVLTDGEEKV